MKKITFKIKIRFCKFRKISLIANPHGFQIASNDGSALTDVSRVVRSGGYGRLWFVELDGLVIASFPFSATTAENCDKSCQRDQNPAAHCAPENNLKRISPRGFGFAITPSLIRETKGISGHVDNTIRFDQHHLAGRSHQPTARFAAFADQWRVDIRAIEDGNGGGPVRVEF